MTTTDNAEAAAPAEQRDAYSVNEFCARHTISRETLYSMWRKGLGPKRMKAGGRTLISKEAAARWRRQCEAAAA